MLPRNGNSRKFALVRTDASDPDSAQESAEVFCSAKGEWIDVVGAKAIVAFQRAHHGDDCNCLASAQGLGDGLLASGPFRPAFR